MGSTKSKEKKEIKDYGSRLRQKSVIIIGNTKSGKSTYFKNINIEIRKYGESLDEEYKHKDDPYDLNTFSTSQMPLIWANTENNEKSQWIITGFLRFNKKMKRNIKNNHKLPSLSSDLKHIIQSYLMYGNVNYCRLCYYHERTAWILNIYEIECDEAMLIDEMLLNLININLNISRYDILLFMIDSSCFDEIDINTNTNRLQHQFKLCQNVRNHLAPIFGYQFFIFLNKHDLFINKIQSGILIEQYVNDWNHHVSDFISCDENEEETRTAYLARCTLDIHPTGFYILSAIDQHAAIKMFNYLLDDVNSNQRQPLYGYR